MYARVTLIIFLALITADSHAQFWKRKKNKKAETETAVPQPNSRDPFYGNREVRKKDNKRKDNTPEEARRSSRGPTYGLVQEYYERMEAAAKERKKEARLMKKPQYSNPLYFGHKRKPKKRKPSKMKFCEECGIRH